MHLGLDALSDQKILKVIYCLRLIIRFLGTRKYSYENNSLVPPPKKIIRRKQQDSDGQKFELLENDFDIPGRKLFAVTLKRKYLITSLYLPNGYLFKPRNLLNSYR